MNNKNATNTNTNFIKKKDSGGLFVKLSEHMGRMKMRVKNNMRENSKEKEISRDHFSKDKIYYLLTDKEKANINNNRNHNINNDKIDFKIKEYNNKEKEKIKETAENKKTIINNNNSCKIVKNLIKLSSFKIKENKEIRIKKAKKDNSVNNKERKTREKREQKK